MGRYRDFDPDRDERRGRGRGRYEEVEYEERPRRGGRRVEVVEVYEDDHPVVYAGDLPAPYGRDPMTGLPYSSCNRVAAGLLQIFLGVFGAGRFYLGYSGMGVLMILLTVFTAGIVSGIWGIVDGVRILMGEIPDADGLPLRP